MDQNMAGSKKVDRIKNYIFDARQPHKGIFWLFQLFRHFQLHIKLCFWDLMDQNMAGSKKVDRIKNYIFDARQPHEGIF